LIGIVNVARLAASSLVAAAAVGVFGSVAGRAVSRSVSSPAQALRTCVDRWNQGNMLGWGSMSVRIAVRALSARERAVVSFGNDDGRRLCTVSLARRPGDNSWICRIVHTGGYECPLVTSDGMPPLRNANGKTDRRGVLRLDVPLKGTQATPPLSWQRYPHIDGYVETWSASGQLRRGLRFTPSDRGWCGSGSESVRGGSRSLIESLFRCGPLSYRWRADPCFGKRRQVRRGDVVARSLLPGSTTFLRFKVTRVQ
jgi:hypothetical protein